VCLPRPDPRQAEARQDQPHRGRKEKLMGSIYKRGNVWWIKYYRNGKPYRESSRSHKESDAKRLLRKREGEIADGRLPGIYFDKVRFEELAEDLLRDYKINRRKSLERLDASLKKLSRYFGGLRVTQITTSRIQQYIEDRMMNRCKSCGAAFDDQSRCPECGSKDIKPGARPATINRELAALKRMLKLGASQTPPKVDRVPTIPHLKEHNVRKGFFEHADYLALLDELPEYLKPVVIFAYKTGWRRSEIINLQWSQVDLTNGVVRLEPGTTKNDEGRTIYLDEELKGVFQAQWQKRKKGRKLSPYVFPGADAKSQLRDFRTAWDNACKRAGIGKRLFHDFRRTAIRNMIRSGIPERVAMMVSGHKTRTVFDRYNIVNDEDLKLAAQRHEEYLRAQFGHSVQHCGKSGVTGRRVGTSQIVDFISGAREGSRTPTGCPTGS